MAPSLPEDVLMSVCGICFVEFEGCNPYCDSCYQALPDEDEDE